MLQRKDYASLDLRTGKVTSKGKIKSACTPAPTGALIRESRQRAAESLAKEAGLRSPYLHKTTLSRPFASANPPRRTIGTITETDPEAKRSIRKLAIQKEIERRRNPKPTSRRESIDPELRLQVLARDDYTCQYCGTKCGPFHVDHVIPWSKGGETTLENLVAACWRCNLSKGTETWVPLYASK